MISSSRHFVAPSLTEFVMLGILNFIKIGFYPLTKVLEKEVLPTTVPPVCIREGQLFRDFYDTIVLLATK